MTGVSRTNAGRWILLVQVLVLFVFGGLEIWAFPAEMCPYMAASRAIAEDRVVCPSYSGENPIFGMYTFSLGKHLTMIGLTFAYFALRGRSRAAIQAGLLYVAIAHIIDGIPPITWMHASGVGTSLFPTISWAAVILSVLSGVGMWLNVNHAEWKTE
jgi:hypothetical protein